MEGNNSFYDLLKEGYRKKKTVDVVKTKRENVLDILKNFAKNLLKNGHVEDAIIDITKIKSILERDTDLDKYNVTRSDLDLLSLVKAIVLCMGNRWEEAEDLLYQLTEKYPEAIFYALLGIVKSKRRIFKCCRDTLTVAKLQSKTSRKRPFKFPEIDVVVTNLNNVELGDNITIMMAYTKDMKEIIYSSVPKENIIEINFAAGNNINNVGNVIRNHIFPIIRKHIDSMLTIEELEEDRFCSGHDIATQTEDLKVVQSAFSIGIQAKITSANKSTQTIMEKNKELAALKATVNNLTKENSALKVQVKNVYESLKYAQLEHQKEHRKVSDLEQQVKNLRTISDAQKHKMSNLELCITNTLEKGFKEVYLVKKNACQEVNIKYDTIDAVIFALREELELLGLKNDLDAIAKNVEALRKSISKSKVEINQWYQHINKLLSTNQYRELLLVPLPYCTINEPPNILLDFVSKLITICRNKRAYSAEIRPDAEPNPLRPPEMSEFPPIATRVNKRQRQKIIDRAIFDQFVAEVHALLPNCSRQKIAKCVSAIRDQRRVPLSEIGVGDVVDFFNCTVVSVRQSFNDNANCASNCASFEGNKQEDDRRESICPICLESCVADIMYLECTHLYHSMCIREWLNNNNQCPICRYIVRLDSI